MGEEFGRLDGRTVEEILNGIFNRCPRSIKAVGFKIFYYHPLDDSSGYVWQKLLQIEDLYVIHLKRRNILRTLTSRKLAMMTDIWSRKDGDNVFPVENKRVTFTADELQQGFHKTRDWEKKYALFFANRNVIDIYYEDIVADHFREIKRICNFIGLPEVVLTSENRKQNPEKLSALIANYSEVKRSFANTEWEGFFED